MPSLSCRLRACGSIGKSDFRIDVFARPATGWQLVVHKARKLEKEFFNSPSSLVVLAIAIYLENELDCELDIAPLDVAIWSHAFLCSNESISDVICSGRDIEIRVIERIEHLAA